MSKPTYTLEPSVLVYDDEQPRLLNRQFICERLIA